MKNLPILTTWAFLLLIGAWQGARVWSQDTDTTNDKKTPSVTEAAPEQPSDQGLERAQKVLHEAREALFQRESIQAHVTQTIALGDYRFRSEGDFISASGFRFKLEYHMELGQLRGTFLEVCDGQMLHTQRTIQEVPTDPSSKPPAPETEVSRRDIQRILKETRRHLDQPEALQAAELGIGGLPAILASLERTMVFDRVEEEMVSGQAVQTIQGKWNPTRRQELLGGLGNMANNMAAFMPDLVRVAFDAKTHFPLRIQYLKLTDEAQQTYQPIMTLAFSDIHFNVPVSFNTFTYLPPQGLEEHDETTHFIQMIQSAAETSSTPESQTP
ncbi:MAG: hypothetical protein KDA90_14455 [Planctomycetaceae bacterium]|nr:hypothetical protein [Planctomycetaceae bacterium]